MGYLCANGDGHGAALLVTNLDNGETYAVCPACLPGWARAMSEAFPVEPDSEVTAECPACGQTVALSEAESHWATAHGNTAPGPDDESDEDEPRSVPDFPAPTGRSPAESSHGGPPGDDTDNETADPIERGKALNTVLDPTTDPGPSSTDVDEPEDNAVEALATPATGPAAI